MKKFSFKTITTLWITLLITIVCFISTTTLVLINEKTAEEKTKNSLITTVQNNVNEMEYSNGILEVEHDFTYYSDGIYTDLFSEDGYYLKGETPHSLIEFPQEKDKVLERNLDGENYYIYSRLLSFSKFEYEIDIQSGQIISYEADVQPENEIKPIPYNETHFTSGMSTSKAIDIALSHAKVSKNNATILSVDIPIYQDRQVLKIEFIADSTPYEKVYIRAICLSETEQAMFGTIGKSIIYTLPLFIVITALGAYIIAKKTISPIEKITESAQRTTNGNDLSKRIEINNSIHEISTLASTFNQMFERLQSSFENEKRFTSDASHELRTPLAVIKAECEYALSQNADDEDKVEALESIKEQTDKMTSLVSSLLAVTRAEQSQFILEPSNLSILVKDVCNKFKPAKNISIKTNIEQDVIIDMNLSLMTQLIENLISNANKYGKENGTIDIKLYSKENIVYLQVKDNGIGIKEENLPKIWNSFYREDSSRTKEEGFGLGLALVKRIATIHNAECLVNSKVDEFTEFTIILKKSKN